MPRLSKLYTQNNIKEFITKHGLQLRTNNVYIQSKNENNIQFFILTFD